MAGLCARVPVTLSIDVASASICALDGAEVSFTAAGTCIINADQAGNAIYNVAVRLQQSITVGRADQSITFTSSPPTPGRVSDTYTVAATGGESGNPVTFSIASALSEVCAIAGSVVTFTGAGACTILANQGSSANYNTAPQQAQSITVSPIAVQVTLQSSQATGLLGELIAFSASVTPSNASGTMIFLEGALPICASVASLGGTAVCTVPFLVAGRHNMTARFNGTGPFDTSTSNEVTLAVVDQSARTTQVIGQFAGADPKGLGLSTGLDAGIQPRFNRFDFWVEKKYVSFKEGQHHDGHLGLLSVGADYVFNRYLLAGVMIQFDDMRQTSNKDRSEIKGTGFMVGPYATVHLTEHIFLQVRGAWGR